MNMVIVITGAAGFIGSHLASYYLDRGDHVVGVDDFSSSSPDSKHLVELKSNKRFKLVRGAIEDQWTIDKIIDRKPGNIDLILNFACPASPPRYQSMPIKTMDTCYIGTRNILRLAGTFHARVVHASTSEIYGDPVSSPQKEDHWGNVNSFGPRSCYDEGKRIAESVCYEEIKNGIDVRIVRIFNTFGPHMDIDDGRVVTNYIKQALRGQCLTVYGDGSQTRSMCYIDDLVEGIVKLGSLSFNPELNSPINLGNPNELTMVKLAELITKKIRGFFNDDDINFRALPVDDPRQRCPDITRAKNLLNWKPKISLSNGLDLTIEYFRSSLV